MVSNLNIHVHGHSVPLGLVVVDMGTHVDHYIMRIYTTTLLGHLNKFILEKVKKKIIRTLRMLSDLVMKIEFSF